MHSKINYEKYLIKANEAIDDVFNEYFDLTALPRPKVTFIPHGEENYRSGQYYISIGNTWQIHLNFGKLPSSYKEFKDEVKVITRHEIEHYQTCPFDILTHLRMTRSIQNIINNNKEHVLIDIGSLANCIADVIIDTKNYNKRPKETLKSEIDWIKKCSDNNFQNASRVGRMMFLLKEALWKEDLELYEHDKTMIKKIHQLKDQFEKGGIDNKQGFTEKAKLYTSLYLELYQLDKLDIEMNNMNGASESNIPCKDDNDGEGSIVIQDPDKSKNAISFLNYNLARESLEEGNPEKAIKFLEKIFTSKIYFPSYVELYCNLDVQKNEKNLKKILKAYWKNFPHNNILDFVLTVNIVFDNTYSFYADINQDGQVNIQDIILIVNLILTR